ncbi:carbohydrate-binding domain-containing protein [Amaricoccus macauensis]|uniref:carbohydrate-binding domain-containing protein n=1 Tax=Amaricoccus macauensis TaxID=57001 RepID=UPI003C7AA057
MAAVTKSNFDIDLFQHVVLHFDGNVEDSDDISALPVAALLAKSAGIADKTTILHSNNLSQKNGPAQKAAMDDAGAFASSLGIDTQSYQGNVNGTVNKLASILNSGEPVVIFEGGPLEATYRALAQVDEENLGNIVLVSHSSWNNGWNESDFDTQPRNLGNIKNAFPEVQFIQIADQNGKIGTQPYNQQGFYNTNWSWMDNSSDPFVQDARDIMEVSGETLQVTSRYPNRVTASKEDDASDAGMLFWGLTGDENGTALDAKRFIENGASLGGGSANDSDGSSDNSTDVPSDTETGGGTSGTPGDGAYEIVINADGDVYKGAPTMVVKLDDQVIATQAVSNGYKDYTFTVDEASASELAVAFVNDLNEGGANDRDINIRSIEVNGETVSGAFVFATNGEKTFNVSGSGPVAPVEDVIVRSDVIVLKANDYVVGTGASETFGLDAGVLEGRRAKVENFDTAKDVLDISNLLDVTPQNFQEVMGSFVNASYNQNSKDLLVYVDPDGEEGGKGFSYAAILEDVGTASALTEDTLIF